jgi:hypothetical protein
MKLVWQGTPLRRSEIASWVGCYRSTYATPLDSLAKAVVPTVATNNPTTIYVTQRTRRHKMNLPTKGNVRGRARALTRGLWRVGRYEDEVRQA